MKQLREFVQTFILEFVVAAAVAFFGLVLSISNTNASQDQRLSSQEEQLRILRIENREDHAQIRAKLDTLLERK